MRTRTVIQPHIIENDSGQYRVWAEKMFCRNEYRFYAKQISVKVNGDHLYIDSKLDTFRFAKYDRMSLSMSDFAEYETRLNEYCYWYVGKITELKRRFDMFWREVNDKAWNEIRRVS